MASVATHPSAIGGGTSAGIGHIATSGLDLTHGIVLYMEGISVSFDGFKALNNLSLAIEAGGLRCVIRPNGPGKTTKMDVLTRQTRPPGGPPVFCPTHHLPKAVGAQIPPPRVRPNVHKPATLSR